MSKTHCDTAGTRALIEVLLLHRHMSHDHVVVGPAAALRAGAITADGVALELHKAADNDTDGADTSLNGASPCRATRRGEQNLPAGSCID